MLDTNVVLSALLFKSGRVSWLVPLWKCGRVIPLASKRTVRELVRVLAYPKFRLTGLEQQTVLEASLPYVQAVRTTSARGGPRCRDPQDEEFLRLAAQGHADYLVTGDEDLLAVQGFEACPIITPEHFRRLGYGDIDPSSGP